MAPQNITRDQEPSRRRQETQRSAALLVPSETSRPLIGWQQNCSRPPSSVLPRAPCTPSNCSPRVTPRRWRKALRAWLQTPSFCGRYQNIERENRVCTIRDQKIMGNEICYAMFCPNKLVVEERKKILNGIFRINNSFKSLIWIAYFVIS